MKKPSEIRLVYMGTPEFAVLPLNSLKECGYNICAVVTAPDKPVGRGLKVSQSAVKQYALENNIKILQPVSLKDNSFLNELKALDAHLFVVVAFRMLPKEVWSMPKFGTFNLHASLLPQYRGAAPINHAIINGERSSGVTTFFIDQKIDTGAILMQKECEIGEFESAGELHDKLMIMGAQLVCDTVDLILSGNAKTVSQNTLAADEILKDAPKLTKDTGRICWAHKSDKIFNLIRGLSPYPAAYTNLRYGDSIIPVKIYSATIVDDNLGLNPGEIYTDGKTFLYVKCGKGSISIQSLQASGKKRLNIKEFLMGFRDIGLYKFE